MKSIDDHTYRTYLRALLAGKRAECRQIVGMFLDEGIDLPELYVGLFQRSLYEVGELWESHQISVAVEHLATSLTESLMALAYPRLFDRPPATRSAIVACTANEYHQLGGRMVADIFELHGWDGYFLGANTPVNDLIALADAKKPDLIALSVSVQFSMPNLVRAVEAIRAELGDIPILVGGQAFQWGGAERLRRYRDVQYVADVSALHEIVEEGV